MATITMTKKWLLGSYDLQLALSLAPLGNDRRSMAITSPLFHQLASIQEETYLLWLVNPVYLLVDHLAKDYLLFSSGVPCPQKQTTNQPDDRLPFIHLLFIQLWFDQPQALGLASLFFIFNIPSSGSSGPAETNHLWGSAISVRCATPYL